MSYIVKCNFCDPDISIENFNFLKSYLPGGYEYMVCSFTITGPNFKTCLRTDGKAEEYAQKWLTDFQMHSKCTMRVERTYPHSGTKNVFKIDLRCQHNTRPRSDKVREKESCKNTDCPAKMGITIKRVVTERKSRSKDPHLPTFPTVLQMDFCHNHPISTPEILRHRSVLPEVKTRILKLFRVGHNPSTALDMHKYDLQLQHGENYNKISQDRALLPDPQFCYRLYYKMIRKQALENGTLTEADLNGSSLSDLESDVKPLSNIDKSEDLAAFEESMNDSLLDDKRSKKKRRLESLLIDRDKIAMQLEDVLCKFCESGGFAGMQIIDNNTVMALCTPLMHRVHTLVKQSGELVFVDAYGELGEATACRVHMFVTHTSAGALPLGCIVTTSTTAECLKAALELWKQILPDGCFYGKSDGPDLFLTNDCDEERESLKASFPQSHLLTCISHVLQSSWMFLWNRKNAIKREHRTALFSKVKLLLFSQTVEELEINYAYSIQDSCVKNYSVFVEHLNEIYDRRHNWSLVYRRHLLSRGNETSIFWEIATILLKDPILSRARTFNLLQIIDFLSRLDTYYERCLIDIANNRLDSVKNSRFLFVDLPQEAYTITQKSESEYEVHDDSKDVTYQLDITLGMCECRMGKFGAPCKHQLLVFRNFMIPSYDPSNNTNDKALLFHLATGQEFESNVKTDVVSNNVSTLLTESCNSDMQELTPCNNDSNYFLTNGTMCENLSQNSCAPVASAINSNSSTIAQDVSTPLHNHPSLNHPMPSHLQQNVNLQNNGHANNTLRTSQMTDHSVPMDHHSVMLAQSQPAPAVANQTSQNQTQTVHELVDVACRKLKERTTRIPQTFIPALDAFLKNLDHLTSDSSLEYALYSFGKFSKSAMPLFKRKVVNNKLVALQSTGDVMNRQHPS